MTSLKGTFLQEISLHLAISKKIKTQESFLACLNKAVRMKEKLSLSQIFLIADKSLRIFLPEKTRNLFKHFLWKEDQTSLKEALRKSFSQDQNPYQILLIDLCLVDLSSKDLLLQKKHISCFFSYQTLKQAEKKTWLINEKKELTALEKSKNYHDAYTWSSCLFFAKDLLLEALSFIKEDLSDLSNKALQNQKIFAIPSPRTLGSFKEKKLEKKALEQDPACLFLDRDGIIIKDNSYPHKKEEIKLIDAILPALQWITEKQIPIIILTNQSGIGRGFFSEETYQKTASYIIHLLRQNKIKITACFHCPFHPEASVQKFRSYSLLRKPEPGMLLQAMAKYPCDLSRSLMVGDKLSDKLRIPKLKTALIGQHEIKQSKELTVLKKHSELLAYCKKFFTPST